MSALQLRGSQPGWGMHARTEVSEEPGAGNCEGEWAQQGMHPPTQVSLNCVRKVTSHPGKQKKEMAGAKAQR